MEQLAAQTQPPAPPVLQAAPAVLHAVIQITRAATGKVEEYTLIGTPSKESK